MVKRSDSPLAGDVLKWKQKELVLHWYCFIIIVNISYIGTQLKMTYIVLNVNMHVAYIWMLIKSG